MRRKLYPYSRAMFRTGLALYYGSFPLSFILLRLSDKRGVFEWLHIFRTGASIPFLFIAAGLMVWIDRKRIDKANGI